MKAFWHKKENNKQLLLIFNGWGFDNNIFSNIDVPSYDIVSLYDYSDIDTNQFSFTKNYCVTVLAWSYGVFIADFYSQYLHNVEKAIAVNGTTTPIHNEKGIPENIFLATMNTFSEKSRNKFYLRIAGGLTKLNEIKEQLPQRDAENQLLELKSLYTLSTNRMDTTKSISWDKAVVCLSDKIFPPNNMLNAWGAKATTCEGEHLPDFCAVINEYVI